MICVRFAEYYGNMNRRHLFATEDYTLPTKLNRHPCGPDFDILRAIHNELVFRICEENVVSYDCSFVQISASLAFNGKILLVRHTSLPNKREECVTGQTCYRMARKN